MQVSKSFLSNIFSAYNQYTIPVFQRHYAWKRHNWNQLWQSIIDLYEHRNIMTYFMGTMVFSQTSNNPNLFYVYNVIDGQQRLITISALLIAIRNVAYNNGYEKLADKINDMLIFSPDFNQQYYRIQPRYFEKNNYESLILQKPNIKENIMDEVVKFFSKKIEPYAYNINNLDILYSIVISRLEFVNITLDDNENIYRIFKNLNSMGIDLTEADLIRGFVFENIDKNNHEEFDKHYWKKLENNFSYDDTINNVTLVQFFQDFLIMKKQKSIPEDQIFINFQLDFDYKNIIQYINQIIYFSDLYSYVLGNNEYPDIFINYLLGQIRKLKDTSIYPLALKMLYLFELNQLNKNEFEQITKLIMSFIIRKVTCGAGARNYASIFISLINLISNDPINNITKFLSDKRGFPSDDEFRHNLINNSYHTKYYRLILENIENNKNHNELVDFSKLQMEHIMPKTLNEDWINNLGQNYENIHKTYLNMIGNLTLTGYNRKLYNHKFETKKEFYQFSNITITRELCAYHQWTENEIKNRNNIIADLAISIYPAPIVNYNYTSKKSSKYMGVDLHKGMWRSRIGKNNKQFTLGYFDNEIDAALAYNKMAIEFHGKNAKLNAIQ